jgi:hypothetical protein
MPISRRYMPEHPPGEKCNFGLDYSGVIPPGVGIQGTDLEIFTNTTPPLPADADWFKTPVTVSGRIIYCSLSGGIDGKDYQLRWTVTDTDGNIFPRTTLVLCAQTS